MLDRNKWDQYGFLRNDSDILGITLHEIGDYKMNAHEYETWLNDVNKTSSGFHYICDCDCVVQVMPDNWAVYHTDKFLDWGNCYTLAIGIIPYLSDEKYGLAQDNAVELIKHLQEQYHIANDMIFFHNDFDSRSYCPRTILDRYKSVKRFVMEEL